MARDDKHAHPSQETLRREAAQWFARMRGPTAPDHQAAFDQWRGAHADHQRVYDRLTGHWEASAVLGLTSQGSGLIPSGRSNRTLSSERWRWLSAPLAAGVMAAAGVFFSPVRPDWVDYWPVPSAWSQRIATKVGQISSVRLADGSTVTLDTDTILVSRISRSARRLALLRGRARFDVAHDASRPFVVAAGGASVAARGTLFDVSLSPGHKVAVTLIRGVVDVQGQVDSTALHPGRRLTARLAPGQQIAFGAGAAEPKVQPVAAAGGLWPEGLLTFESTPLSEAVAQANRYSSNHIRLGAPTLGALQVSGVFRATEPRAFADSLAAAFNLQIKTEPDGDLVLVAPNAPAADPAG